MHDLDRGSKKQSHFPWEESMVSGCSSLGSAKCRGLACQEGRWSAGHREAGQAPAAGAINIDLKSCREGMRDLSSIGDRQFQEAGQRWKETWGPFRFSRMWQWQGNWVFSKWKIFMRWAEAAGEALKMPGSSPHSQIFLLVINFSRSPFLSQVPDPKLSDQCGRRMHKNLLLLFLC